MKFQRFFNTFLEVLGVQFRLFLFCFASLRIELETGGHCVSCDRILFNVCIALNIYETD